LHLFLSAGLQAYYASLHFKFAEQTLTPPYELHDVLCNFRGRTQFAPTVNNQIFANLIIRLQARACWATNGRTYGF
jgi:hypothetical protein